MTSKVVAERSRGLNYHRLKTNVDANDRASLLLQRNLTKVLNVFHNSRNVLRNLYRICNCLNLDLEITFNDKLVESYSSSL